MQIISVILEHKVIRKILGHLASKSITPGRGTLEMRRPDTMLVQGGEKRNCDSFPNIETRQDVRAWKGRGVGEYRESPDWDDKDDRGRFDGGIGLGY